MTEPAYFFTLFDNNYVPRARTLLASLHRHVGNFRLVTLCMDRGAWTAMCTAADPCVIPISLMEFEDAEPDIRAVKASRTPVEYYFLCSSALAHHLFARMVEPQVITLLDADTYFFSNPAGIFEELQGYSIGITEHRFATLAQRRSRFGRFNVGWVTFRRDANGLACARWWRERCIEWCYDRVEHGRFADQRYLDEWPVLFDGVRIIRHKGVNLGPWNLGGHRVVLGQGGIPCVDGDTLVHYHFAEVRQLLPWLYSTNLSRYLTRATRVARRHIYEPYLRELQSYSEGADATRRVRHYNPGVGGLRRFARRAASIALGMLYQEYVLVRGAAGR